MTLCATHDCGCPHVRGRGLAAYSRDPIKKIGKLTVKKMKFKVKKLNNIREKPKKNVKKKTTR